MKNNTIANCFVLGFAIIVHCCAISVQAQTPTNIRVCLYLAGSAFAIGADSVYRRVKPDILLMPHDNKSFRDCEEAMAVHSTWNGRYIADSLYLAPYTSKYTEASSFVELAPIILYKPSKLQLFDTFPSSTTGTEVPFLAIFGVKDKQGKIFDTLKILFHYRQYNNFYTDTNGVRREVQSYSFVSVGGFLHDYDLQRVNKIKKKIRPNDKVIGVFPIQSNELTYSKYDSTIGDLWHIRHGKDSMGVKLIDPFYPWTQMRPEEVYKYDETSYADVRYRQHNFIFRCSSQEINPRTYGKGGLYGITHRTKILAHTANIRTKTKYPTVVGNNGDPRLFGRAVVLQDFDSLYVDYHPQDIEFLRILKCTSPHLPIYNDYIFGDVVGSGEQDNPGIASNYSVSPNPNTGRFTVNAPPNSAIELFGIGGILLESGATDESGQWQIAENLPSGVYIVVIRKGIESRTFKIVSML